jgi:hypothetical protein
VSPSDAELLGNADWDEGLLVYHECSSSWPVHSEAAIHLSECFSTILEESPGSESVYQNLPIGRY